MYVVLYEGHLPAKPDYPLSVDLSIGEYHNSQQVRCLGSCRMFSHHRSEGRDCTDWLAMDLGYYSSKGESPGKTRELKWKLGLFRGCIGVSPPDIETPPPLINILNIQS